MSQGWIKIELLPGDKFTTPIRWSLIARDITARLWRRAGHRATACCHGLWRRFVPATLRIQLYRVLGFLGSHWYGPNCSLKVQHLPFGLYLKTKFAEHHQSLVNEQAALQLVRQHTNVPVPCPLDLVSDARTSFLLMTRAPGIRLGACIDTLCDDEADVLAHDLQQCLGELRAVPRYDDAAALSISNALGEPLYDHRVNMGTSSDLDHSDFKGPFANEDEFNQRIANADSPPRSRT
ncbi:hypothetical protein F503_06845 [Ophiostoma piceae UAMH 11346]|uniref:Aminoglycoside phosphotransferase domain-containing protein n=1 Tax=Ophiostoma piceae (strain UAMH 11346) TaxID=1262450 RepID=S3C694_OPHP1|nr:hypothetical protein F503_06845 [Ophiostoma piceae UAMH 11346]